MLRDVFVRQAETRETPLRSKIEAVVDAYLASYAAKDIEGRLALFAPEATFEDPVGSPAMSGAALRTFFEQVGSLSNTASLRHLAITGREAAMMFEVVVTAPDGDRSTVTVIETMEVDDDGRLTRLRAFWDRNTID